jgi:hypothetical protein
MADVRWILRNTPINFIKYHESIYTFKKTRFYREIRKGKDLHQYIKTSKHQNLLSVRIMFLESKLCGYA